MSRAQEIVNSILSSERYGQTRAFSDRVYRDEPILRTGSEAFAKARVPVAKKRGRDDGGNGSAESGFVVPSLPPRNPMPEAYRKLRSLARREDRWQWSYTSGGAKSFYEQARLMEDFEDSFEGAMPAVLSAPSYNDMSDYELRLYFTWRTRVRALAGGEASLPNAPSTFLFVYANELLCGIGVKPGKEGFAALDRLSREYAGTSTAFDSHIARWKHDYIIYHGLDSALMERQVGSSRMRAVEVLRKAESALLAQDECRTWPNNSCEGLPSPEDLLDAMMSLSRYRADRSRFIREHREDVSFVASRVFASMVFHCHKRRKNDYMHGLFGPPTRTIYTMFPSALFWSATPHEDATYTVSEAESYECERGFWWRNYPCRRTETSKELGALMHAIDAKLRIAMGDKHPLKERPLPKYQSKFVDDSILELTARREEEAARHISIDRSSLGGIRSAAARTREALLTDEEREDEEREMTPSLASQPTPEAESIEPIGSPQASGAGLTNEQTHVLKSLLEGETPADVDSLTLSLMVDAINELFLDLVGDVVIEFDGDTPMLVEDYEQDVRDVLV